MLCQNREPKYNKNTAKDQPTGTQNEHFERDGPYDPEAAHNRCLSFMGHGDAFVSKSLKEALASEHLEPLTENEEQEILNTWNKQMNHNQCILTCGVCGIRDVASLFQNIPSAKFKNVAATQFLSKHLSDCRCFAMPHIEKRKYLELSDRRFLTLKLCMFMQSTC